MMWILFAKLQKYVPALVVEIAMTEMMEMVETEMMEMVETEMTEMEETEEMAMVEIPLQQVLLPLQRINKCSSATVSLANNFSENLRAWHPHVSNANHQLHVNPIRPRTLAQPLHLFLTYGANAHPNV
jgi:translation elongation factor EF-Tu-like GTPase